MLRRPRSRKLTWPQRIVHGIDPFVRGRDEQENFNVDDRRYNRTRKAWGLSGLRLATHQAVNTLLMRAHYVGKGTLPGTYLTGWLP